MISLLLFNNFYPVTSYRRVQKKKKGDELLYTVRSLVMVRNQLPAQVVKPFLSRKFIFSYIYYIVYIV